MIVHDVTQGSPEWEECRLAIPTTSCFHRILTTAQIKNFNPDKPMKLGKGAMTYAWELVAEALIGEQTDGGGGEFMARGSEMEPEAVAWYEFDQDVDTKTVGFITTDDGMVGCSPDRLVGKDGLCEVKNPSAKVFVATLMGENEHAHRCQVQGQMWVTGRKWNDLLIFNPVLPPILKRFTPDPKWIKAFKVALEAFQGVLSLAAVRLREKGIQPEFEPPWWAPIEEPDYSALNDPNPPPATEGPDMSGGIADVARRQRESR